MGVNQAHLRLSSEHRVVTLLPVDQLQLVEPHILCSLLDRCLLLNYFLLQLLDQFKVLGPRRSLVIKLSDFLESFVELPILLVHEHGGILEFALKLTNFVGLFLNELLHGLSEIVLQLYFLFFELVLNFTSSSQVLLNTHLHPLLRLCHFTLHRADLLIFALNCRFQSLHILLKLLNLCLQRLYL